MDRATKTACIENGLSRAAYLIGDIAQPLMARFYEKFPDARRSFDTLSFGNGVRLESEMAGNVLYCIMNWFDRPEEIKIILCTSVPHHEETLHVPREWYRTLLADGIDLIATTIPAAEATEIALWGDLRESLLSAVDAAPVA
jgi:hypothetical protein